ncbi:PREDICTED: sulfhydryl oxidase 1-like [Priapulus caudatus]|uniref:Sulfhydryl oxidase n=1 Tax=Priapulus caudatus TaxID=37621 RepID=A0ABM1EHZ1_PRICU|nr:PREDICTED: sulfhydryl oxidase 1-like [Priapulus caudatus]
MSSRGNSLILLLSVCTSHLIGLSSFTKLESLYSHDDPIVQLSTNNFKSTIFGKSNAWVVEFYSSWCGHCQRFAPVWRQVGREISSAGWQDVVNIAAVNCAEESNSQGICREYSIDSIPSVKYLKPFTYEGDIGIEINGSMEAVHFTKAIIKQLEQPPPGGASEHWPNFEIASASTVMGLWKGINTRVTHHLLVTVEDGASLLGRLLSMDTRKVKALHTMRVLPDNKGLLKELKVTRWPTVYLVHRDGTHTQLSHDATDRHNVLQALVGYHPASFHAGLPDLSSLDAVQVDDAMTTKRMAEKNSIGDHAHMQDLESALYYSLANEVTRMKTIAGENLDALKGYVVVLAKYFPGQPHVLNFIQRLLDWLHLAEEELDPAELVAFIREQNPDAYLPPTVRWVGCLGSKPQFRNYPCGLWTMFHTLTISAEALNQEDGNADPREVLYGIQAFVQYFFGCRECSSNFHKMAVTIDGYVNTSADAVMWLWQAHNRANARLAGDITEDPQHPKVQFPTAIQCARCHGDGGVWDRAEVLVYLRSHYGIANIHLDDNHPYPSLQQQHREEAIQLPMRKRIKIEKPDYLKDWGLQRFRATAGGEAALAESAQRWERIRRREVETRTELRALHGSSGGTWDMTSIDISLCAMVYITVVAVLVLCYYFFILRRKQKYVQPLRGKYGV